MKLNTLKKILKEPYILIGILNRKGYLRWISDENYLKWRFKKGFGKELNLNNPRTFNEKLQWLKLYDRNPLYINLVDKLKVRKFVAERIGLEYLVPLYGYWDNFEDINFNELPNSFVLKTTHDSGSVVICKDKVTFDKRSARKVLNKSLKTNYFYSAREWPYKNVEPKIIAEKLLVQENDEELRDYRLFCFDGEPKFIAVDFSITDKSKTRRNLYDLDWNLMDATISYPRELKINVAKPEKLQELIELGKKLSKGLPHARVDFYIIENQIKFGEITLFHQAGMANIDPQSFDLQMGDWVNINS